MAEDANTRNLDSTGGGGLGDGSGVVAGPPDGSGVDNNAPGGLQTGDAGQGSGAAGFFAWLEALWSGRFGSPPLDPFVIYPGGVDSTGRFHGTYGFGEVTLLDQGLAAFFGPVGSRQSPADQYFELTGRRDFGRTTLLDSPDLMAQNVPAGAQVPSGFGEIFIDTDPGGLLGYWANKLGLTADELRQAAEMGLTAEDLRLAENITVVAPRNDVVSPGKDSAPTTSPMGPPPPSAPPTSDPASSPLPPISVAPPGAGSGGPGPSPVRERGYSIEPLPPISGSNDALLFNPTASYWKYWRDRGRQAERKANPDVRDLHDIYQGKLAAPLAALEDLVIGIFNVPHGIVNHGINWCQHLGRSYLLASERGEYAEAYAEYLDAFISLSVGFLDLASLGESGSVPKTPRASLGPAEASTFADMSAELNSQFADTAPISYRSTAAAAVAARVEFPGIPGFQTHATAPSVRGVLGQAGWQSAHIVPQAAYRALNAAGRDVSVGRAITIKLPRGAHQAFDASWVPRWNAAVRSGQPITAGNAYTWVSDAINQVSPLIIDVQTQGAILTRLQQELFGELGLGWGLSSGPRPLAARGISHSSHGVN